MTMLTRWNPFRSQVTPLAAFPEINDIFRGFGLRQAMRDMESTPDIRVDVSEDEQSYRIKADVPGVNKDDIQVSAEGNQVTISAEVKREKDVQEQSQLYSERYYGRAYRSFTLPGDVDEQKAEAHYENGVLTLTLPKRPNGQSRRIAVS